MIPLTPRAYIALFIAVGGSAALSLWLLVIPGLMTGSTYAAVSALMIALGAVTIITARNGRPTGSLGQMLYETEHPDAAGSRAAAARSRW